MQVSDIGVIRLGRAAGKMKYLLVDKVDASLSSRFKFEVRVIFDPDGDGIAIIGWIRDLKDSGDIGRSAADYIWQSHFGPIPTGFTVVNKNNIRVDCRSENLQLVRVEDAKLFCRSSQSQKLEETDYWIVIQHVLKNPFDELMHFAATEKRAVFYNFNGDAISEDNYTLFYECHFAPCVRTERHMRQFDVCGRCQSVRYCSPRCHRLDWAVHKRFCYNQRKLINVEQFIDR